MWHLDQLSNYVQYVAISLQMTAVTLPVEGDPSHIISQYHTGGHEQLGELTDVKSKLIVSLELYAAVCQQVNRVLCIHVLTIHGHISHRRAMRRNATQLILTVLYTLQQHGQLVMDASCA